jgi:hypothetical protein
MRIDMMTYLELTTRLAAIDEKYSKHSDKGQREKTKLIIAYNRERRID